VPELPPHADRLRAAEPQILRGESDDIIGGSTESGSGSIALRTGDADEVRIEGRIVASDWRTGGGGLSSEERVRRLETNPPIEQTGNRVRIGRIDDEALLRNVSISYIVTVPDETTLVARTGSASIEIEGLGRAVEARTGSGSVHVSDLDVAVTGSVGRRQRVDRDLRHQRDLVVLIGSPRADIERRDGRRRRRRRQFDHRGQSTSPGAAPPPGACPPQSLLTLPFLRFLQQVSRAGRAVVQSQAAPDGLGCEYREPSQLFLAAEWQLAAQGKLSNPMHLAPRYARGG
jgi:hypothetical protein